MKLITTILQLGFSNLFNSIIITSIMLLIISCSLNKNSTENSSNQNPLSTPLESDTNQEETSNEKETESYDDTAQQIADEFWKKTVIKCGENFYCAAKVGVNTNFYECKNAPIITVDGSETTPKELTEVDKLNGVDPQPIKWNGKVKASFNLCRKFTPGFGGYDADNKFRESWTAWFDTQEFESNLILGNFEGKTDAKGKPKYTTTVFKRFKQWVSL